MDGASVTALLAGLLFHPNRLDRAACARVDPRALAAAAEREQVLPLVLRAMQRDGWDHDPRLGAQCGAVRAAVRHWALHEALERAAVIDLLDRAAAIRGIFFKGAALAFTTYAAPQDRMRVDWDLLIAEADVDRMESALAASGFVKDVKVPRGLRNRQASYRRAHGAGECAIDLHTGVVNAPALAERIRFDDLFERSVPIPSLQASARAMGAVDALVLACLHRLSHHSGEHRLIWDYDIHLLAAAVDPGALEARAAAWRVGPLVAAEVARVAHRASSPVPGWVGALASQPSDVAHFTRPNRSRGDDFLIDWGGLGWRGRATLVRETLLPDPAFVRASSHSSLPLPFLYIRRAARGLLAWIRRPRTNRPA